MKTIGEVSRFLANNQLGMRVSLTREGFRVELTRRRLPCVKGLAQTLPDAIDRAFMRLAVQKAREASCRE